MLGPVEKSLGAIVVVAALSFCGPPASAVASEAGSTDTPQNLFLTDGGQDLLGQTFTVPAGADTFLFRLEILRYHVSFGAGNFWVDVTDTDGSGLPAAGSLFSFQGARPFGPAPITVYPNLTVIPGHKYAVFLSTPDTMSYVGGSTSNPYAGGNVVRHAAAGNTWSPSATEDLGFKAEFNTGRGATITSIDCPETGTVGVSMACSVQVSNGNVVFAGGAPTGAVGGDTSANGEGSFSGCGSLSATNPATCTLNFKPADAQTQTVGAHYVGDVGHLPSDAGDSITISKRTTSDAGKSCSPTSVKLGQPVVCSLSVEDGVTGTTSAPTGSISWTSTGAGSFSPNPCSLVTITPNVRSGCASATYTATATGSHTLKGSYGGDTTHAQLNNLTVGTITVAKRASSSAVSCSSTIVGRAGTCTATVSDSDSGTATTPTGSVTFNSSAGASLSGTSCSLGDGHCSVGYTPSAAGADTITASYGGDAIHDASQGTGSASASDCTPLLDKLAKLKKKLKKAESGKKRKQIRHKIAGTRARLAELGC